MQIMRVFTSDCQSFIQSLDLAAGCLESTDIIPVLTHFCFLRDSFYAYDDRAAVKVDLPNGLFCAIPGAQLMALLKPVKGRIEIIQENDVVTVESNAKDFGVALATLPTDSFLFEDVDPEKQDHHKLSLTDKLIDDLQIACESVSKQPLDMNWSGVNLVDSGDGWQICATDNMTLASLPARNIASTSAGKPPGTVIIPVPAIKQLARIRAKLKGAETAERTLYVTPTGITADFWPTIYPNAEYPIKRIRVVARTFRPTPSQNIIEIRDKYILQAVWCRIPDEFHASLSRALVIAKGDTDAELWICWDGYKLNMAITGKTAKLSDVHEVEDLSREQRGVFVEPRHVERYASEAVDFAIVPGLALCFRRYGDKPEDDCYFLIGGSAKDSQLRRD